MQKFKSPAQAQQFLSAHGMIYGHFRLPRHLMTPPATAGFAPKCSGSGDRRRVPNRTSDEAGGPGPLS